jgi:hypothetical protein
MEIETDTDIDRETETVGEKAGTREWTGHHFTQYLLYYLHSTVKQKPAILLFRKKDIETAHWTVLFSFPTSVLTDKKYNKLFIIVCINVLSSQNRSG